MTERLQVLNDLTSYDDEDNCSGVRYVVPAHMRSGERCWYSDRILTEGQFNPPQYSPNQLDRSYTCPCCSQEFHVLIHDRYTLGYDGK